MYMFSQIIWRGSYDPSGPDFLLLMSIGIFPIDLAWHKSPIRPGFTQFGIQNIPHTHKVKNAYLVVLNNVKFMYLYDNPASTQMSINDFCFKIYF